jgi:hypothetical protein
VLVVGSVVVLLTMTMTMSMMMMMKKKFLNFRKGGLKRASSHEVYPASL